MGIRAFVFDFDGLILDTESPMRRSWQEVFGEHGLVLPDRTWAMLLGSSVDPPELYEFLESHLGHPVDRAELRERRMKRELELLDENSPLPGVRELIHETQRAGLRRAVASSSDHAWVDGLLQKHRLLSMFDEVVCSDDVVRIKPSPDLYLEAVRRLGVLPNEAIAFEDSLHGVVAAKKAGLLCVAVPHPIARCLAFDEADLVVSSIGDRSLAQYLGWASALTER